MDYSIYIQAIIKILLMIINAAPALVFYFLLTKNEKKYQKLLIWNFYLSCIFLLLFCETIGNKDGKEL